MSANNYILVEWREEHQAYEITHRDADTNAVFERFFTTGNLEEAIARANYEIEKIENEGGFVEYGLKVIPKNSGGHIQGRGRITNNDKPSK